MSNQLILQTTNAATTTMAARGEPRTFQTMAELTQHYEPRFRALREEGRQICQSYRDNRRKLNAHRRAAGETPEQYRYLFRRMRECYYEQGREIQTRRTILRMDYSRDEAKLFLKMKEDEKKRKRAKKLDAEYSPWGRFITLVGFLAVLGATLTMTYVAVAMPGCETTMEKAIHFIMFGILDAFCIAVTYIFWQKLTYSRERWEKTMEEDEKFLEEQRRKRSHVFFTGNNKDVVVGPF